MGPAARSVSFTSSYYRKWSLLCVESGSVWCWERCWRRDATGEVIPETSTRLRRSLLLSDGTQDGGPEQEAGTNLWCSIYGRRSAFRVLKKLPSLLALQQQIPDLAVVAVSMDQDPDIYQRFLVEHHVDLLTIRDADQRVNALYGTVQIPETYIIDKQGVLRRKFVGAQNWTSPEITRYLANLSDAPR